MQVQKLRMVATKLILIFKSIGVGAKLGPVVANVELNVVKLTNYVVGMANFVGTVISTKLSEYLPNISQEQILNKK